MKCLSKYGLLALFAVAFYAAGLVVPWDLGPNGTVSVAEAAKGKGKGGSGGGGNGGNKGKGKGGGGVPPTVSELPIQYMVSGGLAFILVSGGIVYLTRNRSKKQSSEV